MTTYNNNYSESSSMRSPSKTRELSQSNTITTNSPDKKINVNNKSKLPLNKSKNESRVQTKKLLNLSFNFVPIDS